MCKKLLCIILVIFVSVSVHAGIIEIKNWTSVANLENLEKSPIGLYLLPINDDVITLSKKNDLSDIRIVDVTNTEIPYILVKSNLKTIPEKNIINAVFLENTLTKDNKRILVIDTGREGLIYNNLIIQTATSSTNFRKTAKVFISDNALKSNSTGWKELELKSIIYDYSEGDLNVKKQNISLSGMSSRYIKIELTDESISAPLNIESATIEYSQDSNIKKEFTLKEYVSGDFAFDNLSIYKNVKIDSKTQKERVTEVVYEGGIDVEEITVGIDKDDANFNRKVEVQGSNNDLDWVPLITSSIYRANSPIYEGEKLNIKIKPSTYKKLKVIIFNLDNDPLDILKTAKIKLQNVGVMFKTEQAISDLRLVVGNNKDGTPEYNTKEITSLSQSAIPERISYAKVTKNPEYVADIIPFSERKKIMLNLALLLFIIIVGIFGFFWMKNTHHE